MPETVLQPSGRLWGKGAVGTCAWHILETAKWRWGGGVPGRDLSEQMETTGNWVTEVSQGTRCRTVCSLLGFVSYFIPSERKSLVESFEHRKYMAAVWETDF